MSTKNKYHWGVIKNSHKKKRKEFIDYLGEQTEHTLLHDEIAFYNTIKEVVNIVYNKIGPGQYEKEYREEMATILKTIGLNACQEVTEIIKTEKGYDKYVRLDICEKEKDERIIFELKKSSIKGAVDQLVKYLNGLSCILGFLVSYRNKDYELFMFLREDEYYLIYDGETIYKYYII